MKPAPWKEERSSALAPGFSLFNQHSRLFTVPLRRGLASLLDGLLVEPYTIAMSLLLDKLAKVTPAGRGGSALTATDMRDITRACKLGYSWKQINEAHGQFSTGSALAQVYYKQLDRQHKASAKAARNGKVTKKK